MAEEWKYFFKHERDKRRKEEKREQKRRNRSYNRSLRGRHGLGPASEVKVIYPRKKDEEQS